MDRLGRIGNIIRLIANNPGVTLSDLLIKLKQSEVEVTERTVAKDILCLKHEYRLLPPKSRMRNGYVLEDVCSISEEDVEVILDSLHVLASRLNDPEAQQLMQRLLKYRRSQKIAGKRSRSLGSVSSEKRTLRQRDIYSKNTKASRAVQAAILASIRSHRAVQFTYLTPRIGKSMEYKGYPLLLVFHERGWYCITKDLGSRTFHPRRVDRIKSLVLLAPPVVNHSHEDDLNEAEFLMSCGWGMTFPRSTTELHRSDEKPPIVARFDCTVAPYILESLERHPRASISPLKDGTGDVQFKIKLANPKEFLFWIRSFGSHAWIESPRAVRDAEKAEIWRMSERYE